MKLGMVAAQHWDVTAYETTFHHVTEYGRSIARDVLAPQAGERVLDVGCGPGELSAFIHSLGATVVGIDADAGMIARARERYMPDSSVAVAQPAPALRGGASIGLRFEQADGQNFSFATEPPFDAVFSNAALHWMTKPEQVIACVQRALRPGGRFVAEMGGGHNVATVLGSVRVARRELGLGEPPSPWFYPSVAEYATLLEQGGFFVRRIECFERPTPQEPGEDGLARWLAMYGGALLSDLDESARAATVAKAVALAQPLLYSHGRWVIDYVRLRFVALRR
jgi:SAM-dependent methyltransferase